MAGKHILIVGGGVVGLCAAYYARKKGHRVTLVERGGPDHDSCSLGNAGMVVPSHVVPLAAPGMVALGLRMMWRAEGPFYIKPRLDADLFHWGWKFFRAANAAHVERAAPLLRDLHLASRQCFEELAAIPGNAFGLEQKGLLTLCRTEHALREEARTAALARRVGLTADVVDAAAVARLNPDIRLDVLGGVYFPQDCHLTPNRFIAGLVRLLRDADVEFVWSTRATGWDAGQGGIESLHTTRGTMVADEYVIAGGSWSAEIGRGLGLRMPMQAGKGYSLTLPQPRQRPAMGCILVEARVAVTPMSNGLRFGGTMEIAGLNETINPARVRGIVKSVPSFFPEFQAGDFESVQPWCGLRPCSPDGMPYVGRTRFHSNLLIATGHGMMGLSLGPITGRLLAELLSGERPSIDLALLDPDRFA